MARRRASHRRTRRRERFIGFECRGVPVYVERLRPSFGAGWCYSFAPADEADAEWGIGRRRRGRSPRDRGAI
jgi:hypothetical protein